MHEASAPPVPFLDLSRVHDALQPAILEDVAGLLESGAFTNGPSVGAFESAFAEYCGASYCVGVASGLDALRLALVACGIGPGDEVLVPALTFAATFEAVSQAGAVPVPVDVSESDYCIDSAGAAAAVGPRTKSIMPVHLYGRLAEMTSLMNTARAHDLLVIEDACQAHGARRNDFRPGLGIAAAFSFYPGKNLGALGDAGALTTADEELASRVRSLREHGQSRKYHHDLIGWTSRLDTIQAAALLRKLPLLDEWNEQRRQAADRYAAALDGVGDLVLPDTRDRGQVWHLFVIRTEDPGGLAAHLGRLGIGSGRHYPEPPHLSKAYADLGFRSGSFPVAERMATEVISLPIFPGITEQQIQTVIGGVRSWFGG